MTTRSDAELLQSHIDGDQVAFEQLIRRHGPALLGYITKMVYDSQLAQDLFQETFKKVHQYANSYKGQGKFKSWLYSIASNVVIDNMRKLKRQPIAFSLNTSDNDGSGAFAAIEDDKVINPYQQVTCDESKEQVKVALEQLTAQQKATVIMAYYQGMTYKEIAETLNCSLSTVKTHMFRGLKALAKLLPDPKGVTE
ncbi:MAG: RNA polymerase sigma factor [Phycisphaerae bacterium]|nr:RNA polymerase sigma factor [Phycisphaerae bacterium]